MFSTPEDLEAKARDEQERKAKMLAEFEKQKKEQKKIQAIVLAVVATLLLGASAVGYKMVNAAKVSVQETIEEGERNR